MQLAHGRHVDRREFDALVIQRRVLLGLVACDQHFGDLRGLAPVGAQVDAGNWRIGVAVDRQHVGRGRGRRRSRHGWRRRAAAGCGLVEVEVVEVERAAARGHQLHFLDGGLVRHREAGQVDVKAVPARRRGFDLQRLLGSARKDEDVHRRHVRRPDVNVQLGHCRDVDRRERDPLVVECRVLLGLVAGDQHLGDLCGLAPVRAQVDARDRRVGVAVDRHHIGRQRRGRGRCGRRRCAATAGSCCLGVGDVVEIEVGVDRRRRGTGCRNAEGREHAQRAVLGACRIGAGRGLGEVKAQRFPGVLHGRLGLGRDVGARVVGVFQLERDRRADGGARVTAHRDDLAARQVDSVHFQGGVRAARIRGAGRVDRRAGPWLAGRALDHLRHLVGGAQHRVVGQRRGDQAFERHELEAGVGEIDRRCGNAERLRQGRCHCVRVVRNVVELGGRDADGDGAARSGRRHDQRVMRGVDLGQRAGRSARDHQVLHRETGADVFAEREREGDRACGSRRRGDVVGDRHGGRNGIG